MKILNDLSMLSFKDELQKMAFGHEQSKSVVHKSLGQQVETIARHPVSFVGSALKGEAAGLAGGAVGGALVAAPLAAYWAKKGNPERVFQAAKKLKFGLNKKEFFNPVKNIFRNVHPSSPSYGGRMASHLFELGKGETVGGGVLGLGLGMNKFFNKYKNEQK